MGYIRRSSLGKIEAEYNVEWAKLVYLDGSGYIAWDRIKAKLDLRRKYFSGSFSHGVQNSIEKTPTQPCSPLFISSMAESKGQHNFSTTNYALEIWESHARILEILQEASPLHEPNLTTSTKNSTSDFNGGNGRSTRGNNTKAKQDVEIICL